MSIEKELAELADVSPGARAIDGVIPRWVVRCSESSQVAAVMSLAASEGLSVSPSCGGSSLDFGNPPRRLDILLDLSRLSRVVAHEPGDLTVTAECGIALRALDDHLRRAGQFLPFDPTGERSLGGAIATNAMSLLAFRYGGASDLLLGARIVRADGTETFVGSKVVKSVAGYDVPKLMVGTLGAFGVLVEATLRVHPRPEASATLAFAAPSSEKAEGFVAAVLDSALEPDRLAILRGEETHLLVGFGSVEAAVTSQRTEVEAIAERAGLRRIEATRLAPFDAEVVVRSSVPSSELVRTIDELSALAARAGIAFSAIAECGRGAIRAGLKGEITLDTLRALRSIGATIERAPLDLKHRLEDVFAPIDPNVLALMKRLKAELDPKGTLNPGRYLGGI